MHHFTKEKGRRNGSIITEVALVFIIGIITTGFLTYFSEKSLSSVSIERQTESRAAEIADEVRLAVTEYPAYPWLLRYWYTQGDKLEIEYDVEFGAGTETEAKAETLSERYPGLQLKYADVNQVTAMPDEDQKLFAEVTYTWLTSRINQIKRAHHIDYLFCVASKAPYDQQYFLLSGSEPGAARGTAYLEVYPLGHVVTVAESQQSAMQNARMYSSHLADAGDYVDYYVDLFTFGEVTTFIGMTYSLAGLHKNIDAQTRTSTIYAIMNQILLSMICLFIISVFLLHPLRTVQKNIRLYRTTKDSRKVTENLKSIRLRNEIGQLSEDVSDLAMELDDHMQRIQKITAEKERIGTELALATRIQADMLPNIYPAFPDRTEFDIYASMDPAKEVGGDFYDYFFVDEDHLCILMADVSGKGVPAALFMMASMIILQNNAMMGKSPGQILKDTNAAVCANNREEMFVTVWLGILEISTGILTAANAGHEYPVLKEPGRSFEVIKDPHGFVLGGMDGLDFEEYELMLKPGCKLFLYTDGVPEAANKEKILFGMKRMLEALNAESDGSPEKILGCVRRAVDEFTLDAEQFDDLTMLCFEYRGCR